MGRGLRHLRCIRCRQRKVKCDGAKPHCENCTRHGQQCPGYPPQFEFKDEREELEKRFRAKQSADSAQSDRESSARHTPPTSDIFALQNTLEFKSRRRPAPIPLPPTNSITLLRSRLVHQLQMPPHLMLDLYGLTFLPFLPSHIGECSALDSAVELLCYVHNARINHLGINDKMLKMQSSLLSSLHGTLLSGRCGSFTETLASAIIAMNIGHHSENYLSTFSAHALGIRTLLNMHGPPKENEPFYLALLNSIWGLLWTSALLKGEACFQEQLAWRGKPHPDSDKYFVASVIGPILAPIPGLIRDTKLLDTNPNLLESIKQRARLVRTQLLTPNVRFAPLQDEIFQSLASGPPDMSSFYPASAEFLAFLASLSVCLAIARRILTIVEPQSYTDVDELTHLAAADEIARLEEIRYTAFEGFRKRHTTTYEYVELNMNVLSNILASLENQELAALMMPQGHHLIEEVFSSTSPEAPSQEPADPLWAPLPLVDMTAAGASTLQYDNGFEYFQNAPYSAFEASDVFGEFQQQDIAFDEHVLLEQLRSGPRMSPTSIRTAF